MTEYIQLVKGSGDNINVSSPVPIGWSPLPNHWTLQAEFLVFKLRPIKKKIPQIKYLEITILVSHHQMTLT